MCTLTGEDLREVFEKRQDVEIAAGRLIQDLQAWKGMDWSQEDRHLLVALGVRAVELISALGHYKEVRFPEVINEKGGGHVVTI